MYYFFDTFPSTNTSPVFLSTILCCCRISSASPPIDVEDYFDGFTEITKKYNDLRNKLNEKILLVKGHLLLASIGGEALDILHQHKIVDKKTGEVIIDGTSKKK